MYQIFISYRRNGGEFLGKMIYDELSKRGYQTFYDVEALQAGKFNDQLYERIAECQDFLLLLSPGALDRCKNPDDWVLNEISCAIQQRKNIIPIITRDFIWPDLLPASISELPNYEAIRADNEYFDAAIDRLCTRFLKSQPVHAHTQAQSALSLELESKEYFNIKVPLRQLYKPNSDGMAYISLAAFLEKCQRQNLHWTPAFEGCTTLLDCFSYNLYSLKNIPRPSADTIRSIQTLRQKADALKKTQNGDSFFYRNFIFYTNGLWSVLPRSFVTGPYLTCFVTATYYIYDLPESVYEAFDQAYGKQLMDAFTRNLPLALDVWPKFVKPQGNISSVERKAFTQGAILLMDAILDVAYLISDICKDMNFTLALRSQLLCYYKYLRKNKIFLPKELQRRIHEF